MNISKIVFLFIILPPSVLAAAQTSTQTIGNFVDLRSYYHFGIPFLLVEKSAIECIPTIR